MLNPKIAEERLKEFSVDKPRDVQKARIATLPGAVREHALALLGLKGDGTPFIKEGSYNSKDYQAQDKAHEAAYKKLDALSLAELQTFFAAFFPRLAPVLAAWWKPDGKTLYQGYSNRRPFRMDRGADTDESRQERRNIFDTLISNFNEYQEMSLDWFAAWIPYMGAYQADQMGKLFAFAIDMGGDLGDAVFQTLIESGKGDHEIGAMGRHVTRGLLSASREDGWEWIEKLLLAAQRQEGLRQSVLEVVDESHPQAFRRMLKVIRENDLFRFSATVRAADTWFGMNWVAYEKLSVKAANAATETVETFLADPTGRDAVLAETTDGQTVYLALWAMAFDDAQAALRAALPLLKDDNVQRRYAALHLLIELRLKETAPFIVAAFDDPDLRIAAKAYNNANWYEKIDPNGMDILGDVLEGQTASLVSAIETATNEGNKVASFLHGIQNAVGGLVAAIKGDGSDAEETAETEKPAKPSNDDRFERIERNISRFPVRAQELEPVIWEWDKITAHAEDLADRLPGLLGKRPIERLFPFVKMMSSYGRSSIADTIAKRKDKTPEMRELLFDLFADTQSYVRDSALKAVNKFDITEPEAERIEALLTRKAADLRKASLTLLLKRGDNEALASGERLTGAKDANQRVAGLDLLTQMVEKKRQPVRAKAIVTGFVEARADKITAAERAMTEPLLSETHEKATLDNALGLLDTTKLTRFDAPVIRTEIPVLCNMTALRIVQAVAALVEKYKETPIVGKSFDDDEEEVLLGNARWQFPSPDYKQPAEADLERMPLREIVTQWWDSRGDDLRDADGLELVRAQRLATEPGFLHAFTHLPNKPDWIHKQFGEVHAKREPKKKENDDHPYAVNGFFAWLVRYQPADVATLAEYNLRATEATLSVLANYKPEKTEKDWRNDTRYTVWFGAAQLSYAGHPDVWNEAMTRRLLRCVFWLEKPDNLPAQQNATVAQLAAGFKLGMIGEQDMYRALLPVPPPRKKDEYYYEPRYLYLEQLSGRKTPLFDTTHELAPIVDAVRRRVLEVELRRGDTETAASRPALALRYTGGQDVLLKTVAALGKDVFARGYSYYGESNRPNVFSKIIKATFPTESDTFEAFVDAAREAKVPEKRLVEIAVYAPQWAKHVAHTLGYEGLTDGVWWFHAHTKGNDWSADAEMKETWTTEVADKTPLSAEDLTEGAVDVQWFRRVHETLGADRWKTLSDAAKYASSAGGHKRAQLFADALLGNVSRAELTARITDKRNQDAVRSLGLIPFDGADADENEADLLTRYKTLAEFLRTSKQFGAQRQESEKLATRIGMENLARSAGYADPIRLTWAMEAAAVADLKDGAVTRTVGEVSVSLAINDLGMPEITVEKKGRILANIPPAVKKDEEIATLAGRKTEITRQVSRMRESLETAMCRGDKFSGKELGELLDHPILRPLLRNLVFVEAEGMEKVAGYPIGEGKLEDCAGKTFDLHADTALRIAHPHDLLHTGNWAAWQKDCFLRERVQPFKQVFRELYVVTGSETTDGVKSRRYAGQQVNPKQALALFNKRGWVGGGEYDYDGEGPRKTFHEDGYTVTVNFMGYTMGPADVEGSTVEEVRFMKKGEWQSVKLTDVPPRVFSEAMRDLDLVVSVAHVGGVDPEASQSTTEMRAALLREMMGLLKIDNVRLEKSHAIIDGKLATYNVHLGSAVVHRQPGGYLCIVPVHSQHRGRIFLPFVDSDPRTAEVMSKVITLAKDGEIKDPTILEQILRV
ncbi:MAG: DUF4132 domain-containing protein [Armatimonadetes bacterium]|nr:DUF4132 domain-containing protein [Armatimonadota bacterium]